MGNLANGLKKFLTDKNTVTILGVILGVVVLYIGYNYRISQKVKMVTVYYAKNTILGNTQLTEEDIGQIKVNSDLVKNSGGLVTQIYELKDENSEFKYVNFNCTVPANSLFYKDLLINKSEKPDSKLEEIPDGFQYVYIKASMQNTYGNAIAPDTLIDLYAYMNQDDKLIFAKFIEKAIVVDVIDGGWVTTSGSQERTPDYIIVLVNEADYEIIMKAQKIGVELTPTVTNKLYDKKDEYPTEVSNAIIRSMIESRYAQVSF